MLVVGEYRVPLVSYRQYDLAEAASAANVPWRALHRAWRDGEVVGELKETQLHFQGSALLDWLRRQRYEGVIKFALTTWRAVEHVEVKGAAERRDDATVRLVLPERDSERLVREYFSKPGVLGMIGGEMGHKPGTYGGAFGVDEDGNPIVLFDVLDDRIRRALSGEAVDDVEAGAQP